MRRKTLQTNTLTYVKNVKLQGSNNSTIYFYVLETKVEMLSQNISIIQ